jgi:signal transduction histidine kinase
MTSEDVMVPGAEADQLRQQLLQAQRLSSVGAIASSVAHEFNNILTTIINYAKLALRAEAEEAARTQALEKILKGSQRAATIISSMLGFARNTSTQRQVTDLVALIEEMLVLTEKDLSKHRVQLEKKFHGRPRAPIVPAQIEQVLLNLIINARQAMPRGGRLRIEVRENERTGMTEISVSDSGVGIPAERLRLIFEPFYTTKEPDEHGHGGTGLGLSVCRQIIDQHQGRIRVESLVGKGSTFTIKLPSQVPEAGE